MFCICEILEEKWEYCETAPQVFIYFKNAYYLFRREVLYNVLVGFGVCELLSVYQIAVSTGCVVVCKIGIHYLSLLWIQMLVWCESIWYRSIRRWYKCWWAKILYFWVSVSSAVSLGAVSLQENIWNRISPEVNVWCTLINKWISGPFFYDDIITINSFLHVLESYSTAHQ
jgi:hypothetical protein